MMTGAIAACRFFLPDITDNDWWPEKSPQNNMNFDTSVPLAASTDGHLF
jgi:hypothetical protein